MAVQAPAARDLSGDSHALPALWLALSVAVLAIGMPAALVSTVEDVARSDAWQITLGITVWAGLRLSLLWARAAPHLFEFFFWLYVYIFLGVAPTAQIRSGQLSTTTPGMDPALDSPTAWIVVAGLIAYEVGRFFWSAARHRSGVEFRTVELGIKPSRTVVLMGVALVASAFYLSRIGFGAALGSREAAANAREAAWPDPAMRAIFQALSTYPMLVVVGALSQLRRRLADPSNRRLATVLIGAAAVILLGIVNPISSARYTFGTVIFALAVFAGAAATVVRTRVTMASTLLGFLFVFPIADSFRRAQGNDTARTGFFDEYLANPDYDSFWQIANAFSYTVDGLVQPLYQLLGSLFFWVPRALWPGKPIDTGSMLAQYRGYAVENLSAPAWAELLVNAGVAGVVVGFVLFGCILYELDQRIGGAAVDGWWRIPQAILPVYMIILLRGSWLQATGALVTALACMIFVCSREAPAEPPDPLAPEPAADT